MMNDKNMDEACELELPNDMMPANKDYNKIFHTSMPVPKPTNAAAKLVNKDAVMNAVNHGK